MLLFLVLTLTLCCDPKERKPMPGKACNPFTDCDCPIDSEYVSIYKFLMNPMLYEDKKKLSDLAKLERLYMQTHDEICNPLEDRDCPMAADVDKSCRDFAHELIVADLLDLYTKYEDQLFAFLNDPCRIYEVVDEPLDNLFKTFHTVNEYVAKDYWIVKVLNFLDGIHNEVKTIMKNRCIASANVPV